MSDHVALVISGSREAQDRVFVRLTSAGVADRIELAIRSGIVIGVLTTSAAIGGTVYVGYSWIALLPLLNWVGLGLFVFAGLSLLPCFRPR